PRVGRYSACCDKQRVRTPVNRNAKAFAVAAVAVVPLFAGCSGDNNPGQPQNGPSAPPPAADAKHGPTFPECGGVSDQTVHQLTQVAGVVNTAKNSVGCQ